MGYEVQANTIRLAMDRQQWLVVWQSLQKVAYTMVGPERSAEDKADFKRLMTEFARRDPNYRAIVSPFIEVIGKSPGIKQADLLRGMSEQHKEFARYALYFAHELGEIRREKFGNSYKLFPPGFDADLSVPASSAPAPPRRKPKAQVKAEVVPEVLPGPEGSGRSIEELAYEHEHWQHAVVRVDQYGVTAHANTPAEEEVRLLGRAATQFRYRDDASAVACLERAQAICRAIRYGGHPIEWWMRLPKYLESAGRGDEARRVCLRLIAEVDERRSWSPGGDPAWRLEAANSERDALRRLHDGIEVG